MAIIVFALPIYISSIQITQFETNHLLIFHSAKKEKRKQFERKIKYHSNRIYFQSSFLFSQRVERKKKKLYYNWVKHDKAREYIQKTATTKTRKYKNKTMIAWCYLFLSYYLFMFLSFHQSSQCSCACVCVYVCSHVVVGAVVSVYVDVYQCDCMCLNIIESLDFKWSHHIYCLFCDSIEI